MSQKLVCIGNGLVGTRALQELLQRSADAYEVTVFGAEPHLPYNRIALSSVLKCPWVNIGLLRYGWKRSS